MYWLRKVYWYKMYTVLTNLFNNEQPADDDNGAQEASWQEEEEVSNPADNYYYNLLRARASNLT